MLNFARDEQTPASLVNKAVDELAQYKAKRDGKIISDKRYKKIENDIKDIHTDINTIKELLSRPCELITKE